MGRRPLAPVASVLPFYQRPGTGVVLMSLFAALRTCTVYARITVWSSIESCHITNQESSRIHWVTTRGPSCLYRDDDAGATSVRFAEPALELVFVFLLKRCVARPIVKSFIPILDLIPDTQTQRTQHFS